LFKDHTLFWLIFLVACDTFFIVDMSKSKKEFLKDAEKISKDILSLSKKATQKKIFFLNKNEKHSHSISHSSQKSND